MRLLDKNFQLHEFDDKPPPYAILSHTWSIKNDEEVSFHDLKDGTSKSKDKLERCRDWTIAAGLDYFWIDTCCIDKRNDAEIAYAIRSMYRWYEQAAVCFVYLPDVSVKRKRDGEDWRESLKGSRWFTRGWTLQELVASKKLEFYGSGGYIGDREALLPALRTITGIDLGSALPSHAQRLSWMSKRETKRPEDKAYAMLGICDVSLDPRYGEGGESAWRRLQDAITHRHGTIALEVRGSTSTNEHREMTLEALRFDAIETRRNTVKPALAQTCKWITEYPACRKWLSRKQKFFWIKGKPGVGKSTLIKYLDQLVTRKLKKANAIGLHFYFNARGGDLEKSVLGLYRSLLVQLIDAVPELAHELDTLGVNFNVAELQRVLASAIRGLGREIWLFIDALDECHNDDVQQMINHIMDELHEANLFVCFASRHYPTVKVPTKLQLVIEDAIEHTGDLISYIAKLDLHGEELAQIQEQMLAKANGIFLWIVLVVEILERELRSGRFHAVQDRLQEMPAGLPELFRTIVLRDNENPGEFLLCLRWLMYSMRPLALDEWYYAMMAGLGNSLERSDIMTDERMQTFLLSSSKGLAELTVGKKARTAQFIHESVRDFLRDGGFQAICNDESLPQGAAHEQLKQCCVRGMDFELPPLAQRPSNTKTKVVLSEIQRNSLRALYPFAQYASVYLLHHADQAVPVVSQTDFLSLELDWERWLACWNAFQKDSPKRYRSVPTLAYLCAERDLVHLLPEHSESLTVERHRFGAPLVAALRCGSWQVARAFLVDISVSEPDDVLSEVKNCKNLKMTTNATHLIPWRWALVNGLELLSVHLLARLDESDVLGSPFTAGAAYHALEGRSVFMLHHLVKTFPAILERDIRSSKVASPLLAKASRLGFSDIVETLLGLGADINGRAPGSMTALHWAASKGREEVLGQLICAGADIEAKDSTDETALISAAFGGHITCVRRLVEAGADLDAVDMGSRTALMAAANRTAFTNSRESALKIVSLLLDNGADISIRDKSGAHAAVMLMRHGPSELVMRILNAAGDLKHADLNAMLHEALRAAKGDAARMLLERGADPNTATEHFANALQAAAFGNDESMISMLLSRGLDVNIRGGEFDNALQAACAACGVKTGSLRILLDAGADVNAQGGRYHTALQAASYNGDVEVLRLLLDAGAEVNAQGGHHGTALRAAKCRKEDNVIRLLFNAGAGMGLKGSCGC